ncbi:uncharacterized mitochondrial protein AtMg00810-like [Juglans microcarpa x Juglans regia]|uniref:uncharacterized mitochondrial protein AtMg00810-like n=1 Tax=Juglans microcarpa x Juglans regia TaxID=2249226 RepID=UPI001B7F60DC|nr:uncharacterized mitochondrial protein AtMg00810-like [Juglans microcarpa x Juglans regia]
MLTRLKNNITKPKTHTDGTVRYPIPKALLAETEFAMVEPSCYTTTVKHPQWRNAMNQEFDALLKNGTRILVPPTDARNIISSKWVYRIKRKANGDVECYKAQLVANGYLQQARVDFSDTYSLVIKPTTALYGLKQAPRAWFSRLSNRLLDLGFHGSRSDTSLFIHTSSKFTMYILIYVDDILITCSDKCAIDELLNTLHCDFAIKDLGRLNFFLGIEALHSKGKLILSQRRYIMDLLLKTKMHEAKSISTPMATSTSLSSFDSEDFSEPTLFRSMVGALQYLSVTRPDIAFTVNKLSQFMHSPKLAHRQAAKRLLRYLKQTISYGLSFSKSANTTLQAFLDADWAGSRDDRSSTGGFCVFLGPNLISWSCKKQAIVACSSTEAEYKALVNTAAELQWLQSLLQELGIKASAPLLYGVTT